MVSIIKQFNDIAAVNSKDNKILPIIIIVASSASIVATAVLAFFGIYFFFIFIPIAFGLPWSISKLWRIRARSNWNVEDLR